MLVRLATLGAIGFAAYKYYNKNREQVDGVLSRLTDKRAENLADEGGDTVEVAGGPLSNEAQLVTAEQLPAS